MVLPDREANWRPIQEMVLEKIKEIFRIHDEEEEEQKALPKRTYEQVRVIFNKTVSLILQNLPKDD
jgi:hypothetical protein